MTKKALDDLANEMDDEIKIENKTEIGEVFDNLDADKISRQSNMPMIDFNSRLSDNLISNIAIFDEFKAMGLMPKDSNLTMILKRLKVSKDGKGRQEKVQIASANRSADLSGRSGGFMSNLMNRRE